MSTQKSNGKRISSEEQYDKSLAWMVEKADELEDPLLEGEERDKLQRTYDFVSSQVVEYSRMLTARALPYMQEAYAEAGIEVRDDESPEQKQAKLSPQPELEIEPEPAPKPFRDFLDDDE